MSDAHTTDANGPYLPGRLLLAMPGMADPRFHRAVVFLCAHDASGAMGLVINNILPGLEFDTLLNQLGTAEPGMVVHPTGLPVLSGGPVEAARGFVLHTQEYTQKDTVRIGHHFAVTGTVDALRAIASGQGPERMLFALGYAGWGAGQLEREMQENAWLVTDADPGLLFDVEAEHKWDMAMRGMGIDPAMLSGEAGRA